MHEHFAEISGALSSYGPASGGRISGHLLGEVLSRVAVNTPPRATRTEIAQGRMLRVPLPLSEGSVSKATGALVRYHLLDQEDPSRDQSGRPGRPFLPVRLGRNRWFLIGVHVNQESGTPTDLTVVATTLDDAQVLASRTKPIAVPPSREWPLRPVVAAIVAAIKELIGDDAIRSRMQGDWLPLLGVGVDISSPVYQGNVIGRGHDRAWREYDLGTGLTEALGIPVVVENDANALAVRETYGTRVSHHDFALVLVADEGIGAGVAVGGRVYRGSRGLAGEIGHVKVDRSNLGVDGFADSCWCGQPDHVDVFATPRRIRHELGPAGVNDKGARAVLAAAGRALGQGIAALVNTTNPAQVLLVLPPALAGSGVQAAYLDAAKAEVATTLAGASIAKPLVWDGTTFATMCARAAASRVLIEFIDHLSGIDGCPSDESGTPRWTAGREAAALVGSAFAGAAVGAVVGGAIGTTVAKALVGNAVNKAGALVQRRNRQATRSAPPTTAGTGIGDLASIRRLTVT